MASGLPVIGTRVAFQALAASEADGVLTAGSPEEFVEMVVMLLRDPQHRRELGRRARRYVERNHRWEHSGALLESKLLEIVEASKAHASRHVDAR
jgi:glycosyltransferase involved in cell wall biosynthesis